MGSPLGSQAEPRGLPLYFRVRNVIEERIRSGEFPGGSRLPSEHELCRKYGVSRATVREAFRELIASGLVERRHGRGSFVRDTPTAEVAPLRFGGLLEDLYDQVEKVTVRTVEIEERPGTDPVLRKLGLSAGTPLTVVRRARDVDGRPFAWTVNFIPVEIGRRLRKRELLRYPLLRILEERFGIEVGEATQTLRAVLADGETARELGVPFAAPLLFVERLYLARDGRPLQLVQSHYRADRYEFTVRLERLKREGRWRWGYRT